MRKLIVTYIKFLLRSKNQHGIQSPFVYDFITKCLYNKSKITDYKKLKTYKKQLLSNNNTINVTDLGAGSQILKNNIRVISKIAKNAGTTPTRSKLFYRLTKYFKPKTILELGTSLGLGTQAMYLGNPKTQLTTIEGCPNISAFTKAEFKKQNLNNIKMLVGDFSKIIPTLEKTKYDLIFFDGNHTKEATLNYFEMLLPKAHNDSIFIFDDIYWSKGMTEAWEIIKQHKHVTVSIDTFFWGIVFFRKEQAKEHFTIRV